MQNSSLAEARAKTTPMMQQWHRLKEQAQEAFLFFRLGDFYEAFNDDAEKLSQILDLTLTKRQEIPMCGIPWHSSEGYIEKLLALGYTVAIAEQTASSNEKLMERKIIRMISPSTSLSPTTTPPEKHSLFISISFYNSIWAASIIDVTNYLFEGFHEQDERLFLQEIAKRCPKEILVSSSFFSSHSHIIEELQKTTTASISKAPHWMFDLISSEETLKIHFKVHTLNGLGLQQLPALIQAMGAHISYLKNTLLFPIDPYTNFNLYQRSRFMQIDRATIDNLELFESHSSLKGTQSLYDILNRCSTPMGSRLLRHYLLSPLIDVEPICKRQENVHSFLHFLNSKPDQARNAIQEMSSIKDIERTLLRIHSGSFSPRDVLALGLSIKHIDPLKQSLSSVTNDTSSFFLSLPSIGTIGEKILTTLQETLSLRLTDGNIIRPHINQELDDLRALQQNSNVWLVGYQTRLREELGIKTLKVGFTRAFGYYIEVSRTLSEKMPPSFVRRQTLTGQERFLSKELKEFEEKILSCESKIMALESTIFYALIQEITSFQPLILAYAKAIAELDVFFSFAKQAKERNYVKPSITNDTHIHIKKGRHPVIEKSPSCPLFTPNDLSLDAKGPSLLLITGPNMGGKSTYIRQTALLVIMAQIGSYIPVEEASIGIVDKVFSRIGASDDLARGQSTFMVEMAETSHILRNASPRSLILFDEIGRGTSTFDGIAIAQAVAEYVLTEPGQNPRTLFATHYFELTALDERFKNKVKNMTVHVSDGAEGIQFLHLVIEGKADKSYGIHVARLAGMPDSVIIRAKELLAQFEMKKQTGFTTNTSYLFPIKEKEQEEADALACCHFLKKLDLVKLSPLECFMKLIKFKEASKNKIYSLDL
jgi:DNA mismatch repair protein MutS